MSASFPPFPYPPAAAAALPLEPLWFGPPGRRSLRRGRRLALALCGLLATLSLSAVPADGPHPLALLAGLLPLQAAGMIWAVARVS